MPITHVDQIQHIVFEITSHCNLHCPQCARFSEQGFLNKYLDPDHLAFDPVFNNLNLDQMPSLTSIKLEGDHGDPLMSPWLDQYIAAFPANVTVQIVTNGSVRSANWWRDLASKPNVNVVFSIDGLQDTLTLYRIGADFQKIMRNAKAYIAAGGNAVWKMVVFKHNEHQIETVRELADAMGFRQFEYQPSDRNFFDNDVWPIYVQGQSRGQLQMTSLQEQTKIKTHHTALEFLSKSFEPVKCQWASQGRIYVDFLGNVIPCCMTSGLMWRKDISGQLWQKIVGDSDSLNLYHHKFTDIIKSDFYQRRLQESLHSAKQIHHACVGNCRPKSQ